MFKICGFCYKEFDAEKSKALFCSSKCWGLFKRVYVLRICKFCGKKFIPKKDTQRVCSQSCSSKFRYRNVVRVCEYCYKKYKPHGSVQRTCSRFCGYKLRSQEASKTSVNVQIRNSFEYKQWSRNVKERDDFICQMCKEQGGYFHSHHILAFALYAEHRFDVDNGITLHSSCHRVLENGLRREDILYIKLNRFLGWRIFGKIGRLV